MRRLTYIVAVLGLLALVGCSSGNSGGGSTAPVLQSITVTPATPTLAVGAMQQFQATGHYSNSTTKDLTTSVTWSSSTAANASISAGGLATGVHFGTTTITASSSGVSGTTIVTIPAPLTSIAVTPPSPQIAATTETSFTATGTYADGTMQNITSSVTWTSSVPATASISDAVPTKGTALGKAQGMTTITATLGSIFGTATLKVTNATLMSIAVAPPNSSIPLGVLQQFTATGTFSDATTQDITNTVTWASSASGIASITVSGLANGVSVGATTISATSGVSGSTSLTVNSTNLVSLAITPVNPSVAQNTSIKLVATGTFTDGGTRNLTNVVKWSSSDTLLATVGASNGVAKGVAQGNPMITATLAPVTTTATLSVTNATVTLITVTPSSKTIAPSTKQNFNATGTFSDSSTQIITSDVVWASDTPSVATIIATSGAATGVSAGTATISATLGVTGSAPLTVSGATLASLAVSPTSAVLAPASTLGYQAIGTYSDGTTQTISNSVTWTSSDTQVVAITGSGVATGESPGAAMIKAQFGTGVFNTSNVIVESSALQSIAVTAAASSIPVQVELQYKATGTFADGSTQNLTDSVLWTSSAPAIATISVAAGSQGIATGVSPGSSTVTASFGGVAGHTTLTVSNATLNTITVTPASANIALGTSQQFTATGNYTDGPHDLTNQATWTSSNVGTAVVNSAGVAISAATGTTTIKAAMDPVNGTATLTVH